MFTFEHILDLPLIWGGLIGTAILLYALLDGFDLGVGILFPFAPTRRCQDKMMHSIAPFWDANETWLVLGGGGLFAAFPLAYAIVMPAVYLPVIVMLLCLIFRGVAFEFRFKAEKSQFIWDNAFHFGSLGAGFFQGVILGALLQGITVEDRAFAGGPFDWLTAFSVVTGLGVVAGYALLGATWLIMKTDGLLCIWARKVALYVLIFVAAFLGLLSLWTPFLHPYLWERWFGGLNFFYVLPLPLITLGVIVCLVRTLHHTCMYKPFFLTCLLFMLSYLGLGISLWPWVVPYTVLLSDAAAEGTSLSFMLVGAIGALPLILAYTAYCHYVFRGKIGEEPSY